MTDDEVVDVMTSEEKRKREKQRQVFVHTVGHDMAIDTFTTSIK